jgi:hypothetical protein
VAPDTEDDTAPEDEQARAELEDDSLQSMDQELQAFDFLATWGSESRAEGEEDDESEVGAAGVDDEGGVHDASPAALLEELGDVSENEDASSDSDVSEDSAGGEQN